MARKLINQASAYKVVLPGADALTEHLSTVPFEELLPHIPFGSGFVAAPGTTELVVTFTGGYVFSLRYDEKIVPGAVVKAELAKSAAKFEEWEGYKPGRKVLRELRERVVAELTAKALTKTKVVNCYYNTAEQLLILPTISRKLKDTVMRQLVRAVESMKSTTINVSTAKGSLTTRLFNYIARQDVDAFGEFTVGERVILIGEQGKSSFDLDALTNASAGLMEAISSGGQVSELALKLNGVNFRLSQDFLLKGVVFDDQPDEDENRDASENFAHEASVQLLQVSTVINGLCKLFDYTPAIKSEEDDLV